MKITASIVTYHTPAEELRGALGRLEQSTVAAVFVVDNGSEPRIEEICREFTTVVYIPSPNRGYGAGHNRAIRRAMADGADYHLVVNSDIQFPAADIAAMGEYMASHEEVGCLHPRIFGLDGKDQYTARLLPTPGDLFLRRFLPAGWLRKRRERYLLMHLDHGRPIDVHYVQGSFMFLRIATLEQVGLFDERFFMYPEDIDLSRRIAEVARVRYLPDFKAVHAHRQESYHSRRMTMIHIRNMIRYFNKWGWLFDTSRSRANNKLT